ncbi:MAG: hypothetical protein AAF533_10945 [Acidobacteriota bacterium]
MPGRLIILLALLALALLCYLSAFSNALAPALAFLVLVVGIGAELGFWKTLLGWAREG